ncbi:hypothetical protein KIN_44340 [Litoreibacter roseus]|uniref:Integrase catalytic domain-containing protein n=1 Tax=Litoreibacter roseus TaxID=2601869 RepID=A0A6N6JN29_9RHOB|nr:hypothetical protein KIN_44340 [Litoreibacter roseus]
MKKSKFTEAQVAFVLKQVEDGTPAAEDWRRGYNEVRPHSAIGNKLPISLINGSREQVRANVPP